MDVFISWSKATGQSLAIALHSWLPEVIHRLEPWMSSENIRKGQRWGVEIGSRLDATHQGIICVTRENVKESWLNFEAGALAKSLKDASVRPVLFDLQPADVTGPLTQFQATVASDQKDMLRLIKSLNDACEAPLDESRLERSFQRAWHEFETELESISASSSPVTEQPSREVSDIVGEILERTREIQRSMVESQPATVSFTDVPSSALAAELRSRGVSGIGALLTPPELQIVATGLGIADAAEMRKPRLIAAITEKLDA
ncbi:TIR domain-containing protein [Nonomuraea sp. KM90]|uniref:TIR domain-containing protein n=1 Tax=Nonomuraea sp. KM90 TaxID=3457428 RepID=UPI003FCD3974